MVAKESSESNKVYDFVLNDYENINKKYKNTYGFTLKELKTKLRFINDDKVDNLDLLYNSFERKLGEFGIDDSLEYIININDKFQEELFKILESKLTKYNGNPEKSEKFVLDYIKNIKILSKHIKGLLSDTSSIDNEALINHNIEEIKELAIEILESEYGDSIGSETYEEILENADIIHEDMIHYSEEKLTKLLFGDNYITKEIENILKHHMY